MKNFLRRRSSMTALTLAAFLAFRAEISPAVEATLTDDAFISFTSPTTNFGPNGSLRVRSAVEQSFIRFNLPPLPPGVQGNDIARAALQLFGNTVNTPGSFNIHPVVEQWSEESITAANDPALGPVAITGVPVTTASLRSFLEVEITDLVRDWYNGVRPNHGIALVPVPPINARFDSKENTGTSHEPRLQIILSGNGGGNGGIPSGAILLSDGPGCPAGFTLLTSFNNKFLVGSDVAGSTGGSDTHSHGAGNYSGPVHTHPASTGPPDRTDGANPGGHGHAEHQHRHPVTIEPGGGGAISGTSGPADSRPEYKTILLCKKN